MPSIACQIQTRNESTLISRLPITVPMRIGIVGGTGGMGEGFALRWCKKHDLIVGSREAQKAREAAESYSKAAKEAYGSIFGSISGDENIALGKDVDILILSIPYDFID